MSRQAKKEKPGLSFLAQERIILRFRGKRFPAKTKTLIDEVTIGNNGQSTGYSHNRRGDREIELIEKVFIMFLATQVQWETFELPTLPELTERHAGLASWYGSGVKNDFGLHGSITATGETFDPTKRTCAMRSAPLRKAVLVQLARTGARTWCLVNDRGPYGALDDEGRWVTKFSREDPGEWRGVVDLSRATAQALGFDFRRGLEEVRVFY